MVDFTAVAERYVALWNETDSTARADLVAKLFTPDASYVDPMAAVAGGDAINAMMSAVQDQFPGWAFRLLGPVDGHHEQARFQWELGPEGTDAPVVGFDVIVLANDGRIHAVYGFLDKVPAAGGGGG